jgi:hypothetical protein
LTDGCGPRQAGRARNPHRHPGPEHPVTDLTSDELRNYATILAALVALVVFVFNSRIQLRNQRIENISRFFEVHNRLMAIDGFLMSHLPELQAGTFRRDRDDRLSEAKFHLLLLQVEQLAILANNQAVPTSTQVYMFGFHAGQILDAMHEEERSNPSWELAATYLRDLAALTAGFESLPPAERRKFQH